MVNVTLEPEAVEGLEDLPLVIHARVLVLLERLRRWPEVSGAKPLTGRLAGRYRLRTGDWRVQFRVRGQTVVVEKIGHRDRFYE
jgi:mRNA-degrading endonuclease RelE of RelBE toxin-antitoxin system